MNLGSCNMKTSERGLSKGHLNNAGWKMKTKKTENFRMVMEKPLFDRIGRAANDLSMSKATFFRMAAIEKMNSMEKADFVGTT